MKEVSEATDVGGKCLTVSALKKLVFLAHDAYEEDAPKKLTTTRQSIPMRAFMGETYVYRNKESICRNKIQKQFFLYHDALTLMTATETKQWMEERGILKHWILPKQGLNKGTQYKNAPTGNAPEFNALDSSCNRNIHCAVLEHISHTATLQNTDKQKFT
eukprot:12030873-Ditylum_brightwellii.AAC.1